MGLIVGGIFLLSVLVILGGYWFAIVRPEEAEDRALRKRLKGNRKTVLAAPVAKAPDQLSAVALLDRILTRSKSLVNPVQVLVLKSGVPVTTAAVLLGCVFLGLVAAGVILHFSTSTLFAFAGAMCAASLPLFFLRVKADQRLVIFEEQFPEAVDLMARSLRAGHALTTSLQMVGDEVPDPVGAEFRQLFEQQNFGMSLPEALRVFAGRVPLLDARFFVTALLTQRETGGNLSEVLDNLASVIRERFKVKRQVRVMSAHGRITGWVLALLPPVVAIVLFVVSPAQMRLLIDDPMGVNMVVGAVVLQLIGVVAIRKIVNIEY
jgi:tight adherence protein B